MTDNELQHYGVKGMRWGVRRYQPYPKGQHGTFLGQDRDKDLVIKKGTNAYRVQSTGKIDGKGQIYVSFDPNDHLEYLTATASHEGGVAIDLIMSKSNGNSGRAYSVTMKLSNDIVAPSYEKTMDAFVRTVDKMGGAKKFANETMTGPSKMAKKEEVRDFVKNYKKMSLTEARDEAYIQFAKTFMRDTIARNMFFEDLKAQGYTAIVDDWDAKLGKEGYVESPVIVFDKSESVKQTTSRPLSEADYEYFNARMWDDADEARLRYPESANYWEKWVKNQNGSIR